MLLQEFVENIRNLTIGKVQRNPTYYNLVGFYGKHKATVLKELAQLCEEVGEQTACREMRKRFVAYTKGIVGGAKLREQLVQASSVEDYEKILQNFSL